MKHNQLHAEHWKRTLGSSYICVTIKENILSLKFIIIAQLQYPQQHVLLYNIFKLIFFRHFLALTL